MILCLKTLLPRSSQQRKVVVEHSNEMPASCRVGSWLCNKSMQSVDSTGVIGLSKLLKVKQIRKHYIQVFGKTRKD